MDNWTHRRGAKVAGIQFYRFAAGGGREPNAVIFVIPGCVCVAGIPAPKRLSYIEFVISRCRLNAGNQCCEISGPVCIGQRAAVP